MIKNTASQAIGCQMITAADGSAFMGSVTVYVCGNAGSQALGSVGSGVCTHEGNGYHTYAPAQAETNYNLIAFTFIGSGAIPATVQVFTIDARQTGDSFARIGSTGSGLTSLATAAICTEGRLAELDAGNLPTDIAAIPTTAMRGTDNAALASVCTEGRLAELDGANLPADVDSILADTNELQADDYPTSIAAIKAETALIVADTNELQADDYPTSIAAIKAETALIVADTNELQTDWHDGGRLDLILDAAGGAGDPWITALPGAYGAGTAGKIIGDNINAPIATVDTIVDDIKTAVVTNADGADIAADIIALKAVADAIPTTAMRGTDSAALASVCTESRLAELDAANLPTDIAAIPTTAMRGTDDAALASVCTEGRLAELAAANLPADVDTLLTRISAAVALASICTEGRLAELDAGNLPTDIAAIPSAAQIKTALEAAGSDLDYLITALVNKMIITEANGNTEQFSDADVSLGSIAAGFSTDGTYTTRKRMVI